MWRHLFLTIFIILSLATAFLTQAKEKEYVSIGTLQPIYKSFDDISVVIENHTKHNIYSYQTGWGLQLLRFNENTKQWEQGRFGLRCATGALGSGSTPIKPKTNLSGFANWRVALKWDEENKETVFRLADDQQRAYRGKYKLLFQYAYQPWRRGETIRGQIYGVASTEFVLEP